MTRTIAIGSTAFVVAEGCVDQRSGISPVMADEIDRLREALSTIKSEVERIQGGNGNLTHLIRCIHVQVNEALDKETEG